MSGLQEITRGVCDYLEACTPKNTIEFSHSFEYKKIPTPANTCRGVIGLAGAEYLDSASLKSERRLSKVLKAIVRIEILAPKIEGGQKVRYLFDRIAEALFTSNFAIKKIKAEEIKFNSKLQALTLEAFVEIEFMVVLDTKDGKLMEGYELRKEVIA